MLHCKLRVPADVRMRRKAVTWRPKLSLARTLNSNNVNHQVLHVQRENDIVAGAKASPPKTVTFTGPPGPGASKGV